MFKFHNGDYVRDIITNFYGVIVARTDHLTGCNRYFVQPSVSEDGKLPEGVWLDEACVRLEQQTRLQLAPDPNPPG